MTEAVKPSPANEVLEPNVEAPSYEYARRVGKKANKFELDLTTIGVRYALQQHRAIGSLHTFYPGQRAELDYTKYLVWAYPAANWNEPILWHTGIGIDHSSGIIKGYTITAQPSAATGIRLYKRCVLPKRLWLPARLTRYANDWDAAGLDHLIAIDNAMDLQSDSMTTAFIVYGVIVLCMPRRRGDLKGRVERTQQSLETMFIHMLPGYVHRKYPFTDPRMKRILDKAKASAKMTLEDYEEQLLLAILEFNRSRHPKYGNPRIEVYRKGLEAAPMVLPTGLRQINSSFALTFRNKQVTREGVEAAGFKYNSAELNDLYRTSVSRVDVKINPDDVRSAYIYHRELGEPIEANLTTHAFPDATTLELARELTLPNGDTEQNAGSDESESPGERYLQRLHELQNRTRREAPRTGNADAQAAAHAAALPPAPPPAPTTLDDAQFAALFDRGSAPER